MADRIFTFGYEGLSVDAFVQRLKTTGIETVVDVRANPLSRKPGFSKRALAAALSPASIAYIHLPAMGCPKPVRDRYKRRWSYAQEQTAGGVRPNAGGNGHFTRSDGQSGCLQ